MDEIHDITTYVINVDDDPDVMSSEMSNLLKETINDEMDSILSNKMWALIELHLGVKPSRCKFVFKRKLNIKGFSDKFEAILVLKGLCTMIRTR